MTNVKPILKRHITFKGSPLLNEVKENIRAEAKSTPNIDVVDDLTFGKIVGFEFNENQKLKFIMIEFTVK